MAATLVELLNLLTLRTSGPDHFVGSPGGGPECALFGGHVVGQALVAAARTVPDDRLPHSVHCSFVAPGRSDQPIDYQVTRVGHGASFSRRRVVASQSDRAILTMQASFHIGEDGLRHSRDQPVAPPPDACISLTGAAADPADWPDMYQRWGSIDVRIAPRSPSLPMPTGAGELPGAQVWLQTIDRLTAPQVIHSAALGCLSDMTLLGAALAPHSISHRHPGYRVASLDHCIWFHAPFRVDEWILYDQISPIAGAGRSFCRGELYQAGRHIASVVQEGLIRVERTTADRRISAQAMEAGTANH